MNLPTPPQLGNLLSLPRNGMLEKHMPLGMFEQIRPCAEAGWAEVDDHGFYRRTPFGDAAISQACKEPIR